MILNPYAFGIVTPPGDLFSDDFNDNTIDSSRWAVRQTLQDSDSGPQTTISVAETGGQLVMTSGGDVSGGCEAGYFSAAYDFTSRMVSVELAQHDAGFNVSSVFTLYAANDYRIRLEVTPGGGLNVTERVTGSYFVHKSVTYNSITHKFLRLREGNGAIIYEYSADGATWKLLWVKVLPFAATALRIFLQQTTPATGVTAGKFTKFDNFAFEAGDGPVPITPTGSAGGSFSGMIFTKSAGAGWGSAGYSSVESIVGDGFIKWILTSDTGNYRIVGLSTSDPDRDYASVQYGFLMGAAVYDIYESGASRSVTGSLVSETTEFMIQRVGTTLTYYVDGVLKRTVTGVTTSPLFADTALYESGATLGPILMSQ